MTSRRLTTRIALLASVAALLQLLPGSPPARAGSLPRQGAVPAGSVAVGSAHLHRCDLGVAPERSFCGAVRVALNPADAADGTLDVGFGWVPAAGRSTGTVVAEEGGPGYPSTGTAPDYLAMLGDLHADHDLLLVDARGTGSTALLDCASLQAYSGSTATPGFARLVRGCADRLDHTFRRADGSWVHAADLFGTAQDARDLAAVVQALQVGPVDLYGDSYGSWFAQVFTARYPRLLRSVVLDSTYEVRGLDPWYRTSVTTARAGFDVVCARSAACAGQAPGSSWARIGLLAQRLRRHPVSGWTAGLDGARVRVTVGVRALVDLVNDAGYDPAPYRTLDAAARALLDHGDAGPLLRQYAQDVGYDFGDYSGPADVYSDGTYYAVACTDYPQLFDVTAAPTARRSQLAAAVNRLPAGTFAPFSTAEWLQVNQYTEAYSACLDWPAPVHHDPPLPAPGSALDPGGVPVLVLAGELDSLTPAAGAQHVARQLGPSARAVVAANTGHLVALDDRYGCGADLYRRFVRAPSALGRLDASCAGRVPEVHAVGTFPTRLAQVAAATGAGGLPLRTRRLAAVALAAVGDAAARWSYVDGSTDLGLRGGRVDYVPDAAGAWVTTTLTRARWLATGAVSGVVRIRSDALAAHGTVTVTDAHGPAVVCTVSWQTDRPGATARIRVGDVTLTLPAP